MAGSFGFEAEKYPVSVACGERVLLPMVRKADPKTLIMADGFSCREQIAQMTNRQGLHLAQVIQMALQQKSGDQPQPFPEADIVSKNQNAVRVSIKRTGAISAGAAAAGAAAWIPTRRSA